MAPIRHNRSAAMGEDGDTEWFHREEGLNNEGYLPGFPKSDPNHLPQGIVSNAMCVDRWGPRKGGGFQYADVYHGESPRMQRRIEIMFQKTHQRPIGKIKIIGIGFARGILAEKLGYAVNWAAFANKQCHRGKLRHKPFRSFQEFKKFYGRSTFWPANEVEDRVPPNLEGCTDDWELNLKFPSPSPHERFDMRKTWGLRFCTLIERPMYTKWWELNGVVDAADAGPSSSNRGVGTSFGKSRHEIADAAHAGASSPYRGGGISIAILGEGRGGTTSPKNWIAKSEGEATEGCHESAVVGGHEELKTPKVERLTEWDYDYKPVSLEGRSFVLGNFDIPDDIDVLSDDDNSDEGEENVM